MAPGKGFFFSVTHRASEAGGIHTYREYGLLVAGCWIPAPKTGTNSGRDLSSLSSNGSFYGKGVGTLGTRGKGTSHFLIYTESLRDAKKKQTPM